jgi:hypothetical protein
MSTDDKRNLLAHMAARLGGIDELAEKLRMSRREIMAYLAAREAIPDALVLKIIDLVLEDIDRLKAGTEPAAAATENPQTNS